MKQLEKTLREKLELSAEIQILVRKNQVHTKNTILFALLNGESKFVIKTDSKHLARESKAHDYFTRNALLTTPRVVYGDEELIISEYVPRLSSVEMIDALNDIVAFHKKSLTVVPEEHMTDKNFANYKRDRWRVRMRKHPELVEKVFPAINELEDFLDAYCMPSDYSDLPKIVVHGDIHRGNVQRDPIGKTYFLDFEIAMYDFLTWDLSRPITDVPIKQVNAFVNDYVKTFPEFNQEELRERIYGDCICRLVNDGIGMLQSPSFADRAESYLMRDRPYIEAILSEQWK